MVLNGIYKYKILPLNDIFRLVLPDIANKNMSQSVKYEFKINNK